MKHIIPALLLAASVPAFAADSAVSTTDAAPVATYTVPTPAGFPFAVETQILTDDTYQVKITDQKTGKVQIIDDIRKGCIRVEYKSSIRDYEEEHYCWKNGDWEMLRLKNTNAHKKPKGK